MNSLNISPGPNKATNLEINSETDQNEFNYAFTTQTSSNIDSVSTFNEENNSVLDTSSLQKLNLTLMMMRYKLLL